MRGPLISPALLGLVLCLGCRGPQTGVSPMDPVKPALLIGPEAGSTAAPPVELPTREGAKLCVRAAEEFEKNGQVEDAIRLYEKARTDDPVGAKGAARRLAVLYDRAGDFSKSGDEYEALLKAHPNDAELLNDLGYSHYCRGDWAAAETYLTRAVEADKNHKRAWCNLGLAQAQQGKLEEAFHSFTRAVRPAEAHCNIAFVLAAQGKVEDAKARYAEALRLDPALRRAQAATARLANAKAGTVTPAATKPGPTSKYDAAEAAAKVPTIAELEARLQSEGRLPTPDLTRTRGADATQP
jgi:tetratricopeptide (TPR) repeat protein